jgi:hypothetical protein
MKRKVRETLHDHDAYATLWIDDEPLKAIRVGSRWMVDARLVKAEIRKAKSVDGW